MKSIRRQFIRSLMAGAALLLALASCTIEHDMGNPGGGGDGEAFVKFSVWLPGSAPVSRALTENNENHVQTIDILIFEQGGDWVYNAGCSGSDITTDGGDPLKKSFTLKMRQGAYDMVMLANARELLSGMNLTGQSKAAVLAALNETVPTEGKWVADASDSEYIHIPMWGEIGYVTIDRNTQNLDAKDIHLTRMLARVDVQIASTAGTFRLTSVDVYNYNTMGSLAPTATGSWNGTKSVSPNVPASSTLTKGPLEYNNEDSKTEINTTDNKCAMEIYLFEAENHTAGGHSTAKDMLDRTCIVIGGIYGSDPEPSYYRADFSTSKDNTGDDVLDVLRNHHYKFNITKVSASGYGTSEEAFQGANPIEFTVTVTDWGDNISVPLGDKPERWARSNIVWMEDATLQFGGYLTFAVTQRDNETIPANVQGVFFKWGSLDAVNPMGVNYDDDKILFRTNYIPTSSQEDLWSGIPHIDDISFPPFDDGDVNADDFAGIGAQNGYNGAIDQGDICRYISARGWVEGKWRMPTAKEFDDLLSKAGSQMIGQFAPGTSNVANGLWEVQSGRWLGEGAAEDVQHGMGAAKVPGKNSVFFPASGFRNHDNGGIPSFGAGSPGYSGYYWTASSALFSSIVNLNMAYSLNVSGNQANRTENIRTYGFPVRCIRDDGIARPETFRIVNDLDGRMLSDGGSYTITFESNASWEAYILPETDAVTAGYPDTKNESLLDPSNGLNNGSSSATISGNGNSSLTFKTVDYISAEKYAKGELTVVFRSKGTGKIFTQVTINVKSSIAPVFARSNIVWKDSKLTFATTTAENSTVASANSQGVYFKWGSLVATDPISSTYASGQILFSPTAATYSSWVDIPYANETTGKFGTHNVAEDDFAGYNGVANTGGPGYNAATNKGDICRYISAQSGWVEGNWRLPTCAEYDELTAEINSVGNGTFSNAISTDVNGLGRVPSGRWLGAGAATTSGSDAVPGLNTIYLPTSGSRNNQTGSLTVSGGLGYYLSGSSSSLTGAKVLRINSSSATNNLGYSRAYGFSVRCIRDY